MKRLIVILSFFGALAGATVACSNDTDALTNTPTETDKDDTEPAETPPSTKKSGSTSSPPPTTNSQADASTGQQTPASCESAATKTECAKCCGEKNDPGIKACACNAGAKCQTACSANLCTDKLPDIACALCVAQANCSFNDTSKEAQACIQQCASKP